MTKPCDACQSGNAVIYCRADTAYLCSSCDNKVHAANKLASRHERVLVCEVCEHAPAAVTCKADAASLCFTCDNDIHSANPLARRHERVPVTPFYDAPTGVFGKFVQGERDEEQQCSLLLKEDEDEEEEESSAAEAASWLLPHPMKISAEAEVKESNQDEYKEVYVDNNKENMNNNNNDNTYYTCPKPSNKDKVSIKSQQNFDLFSDMDPYLDMDFVSALGAVTDSLVPIHGTEVLGDSPMQSNEESYDLKPHSFCPDLSLSTSSIDVGVVPDASLSDISTPHSKMMEYPQRPTHATPLEPMAREARVLRYREKRKNRKFEKTIRYASRKAYAETRPRIKGRFAKRSEMEMEQMYAVVPDGAFGVVTSF